MKKIALKTFGCRANQYDSAVLLSLLEKTKCEIVDFDTLADVYIINSCAITHNADNEAKQFIRRARKTNPYATAIVTGCSAQVNPEVFSQDQGVRHVVGNDQKEQIVKIIEEIDDPETNHFETDDQKDLSHILFEGGVKLPGHSRSFLKIQDGCSQFCSFCIVPYARGLNRSIPEDEIINALHELNHQGVREVVLTGIHLGTYGKDLKPKSSLLDLLKRINQERPIHRIRLSSIDPEELTDEMIDFLVESNYFCNHLHLPLQSGDNSILKRMKRRYSGEYFIELCQKLHQKWPEVCIGTDIIVGFPGEDNLAFQNTIEVVHQSQLSYIHSFPYSPRKGTKAYDFQDQIDNKIKKERSKTLREISEIRRLNFHKEHLDKTLEVIIEKRREGQIGLSSNYIPIKINNDNKYSLGEVKKMKITKVDQEKVIGEVIE